MAITDFDDQALEEAVLIKEATGATVTAVGLQADGDRAGAARRVRARRRPHRASSTPASSTPTTRGPPRARFARGDPRARRPTSCWSACRRPTTCSARRRRCSRSRSAGRRRASSSASPSTAGRARVVQEYAGGRLAVLGLQLPAVVGVQSASSPPRYVSMTRLRQAMTEASPETLERRASSRPPRAPADRLARAAGAEGRRDDARGRRRRSLAEQIVGVLRERGALVS